MLAPQRRVAHEGFRVLLTCFNKPLGDYLRASLGEVPGLEVAHFHQFCHDFARSAGVTIPDAPATGADTTYFAQLPDLLLEALDRNTRGIRDVASQFYSGPRLDSTGPPGRPIDVVTARSEADLPAALSRVLHRLEHGERVPTHEIVRRVVVLTDLETLSLERDASRLYVGITRARTHLVVVATGETLARLGFTAAL